MTDATGSTPKNIEPDAKEGLEDVNAAPVQPGPSESPEALDQVIGATRADLTVAEGDEGELSPELIELMGKLKTRYVENRRGIRCHNTFAWEKVEAKLRANPEKLTALKRMDDTGGEPDVTEVGLSGKILFDEIALKLPESRRNLDFDQAVERANAMGGGAKLMHESRYVNRIGNDMFIEMDIDGDWVWLDLYPEDTHFLEADEAAEGYHYKGRAFSVVRKKSQKDTKGAFRCSIEV